MKLNKLTLKDKKVFDNFLGLSSHRLSVYAFENIYIWKEIFDIYWALPRDSLCVFFKDKLGCFSYLSPQGRPTPGLTREVFEVMDSFNKNKDVSRIENAEEGELPFYRNLGYQCKEKFADYLCRRADLAELKGGKFKSQRASFNYFTKHYTFEYLPFSLIYRDSCLKLYNAWAKQRKSYNQDPVYQGMLDDSRVCLESLLDGYADLDIAGRIVRIDKTVKAFTFGFELNRDVFCILYEVTDLSLRGLSQFIFRQFCSGLKDYKYINIMDDSGLDNLRKVKLSYHPVKLTAAYIVKRANG